MRLTICKHFVNLIYDDNYLSFCKNIGKRLKFIF